MREAHFSEWLQKERLGQYVAAQEQAFFDNACADIFGRFSVQVGLLDLPFLAQNRIAKPILMGRDSSANLVASSDEMPLAWRSVDLVALPHGLEFSEYPHQVLSEVRRVLVPDGRLLITGFNPISLWGLKKKLNHPALPYRTQMISMARLKDWLQLLGFDILGGRFMVYVPPCKSEAALNRWQFCETAGNRWWPHLAAVYGIEAVKRVHNVHPLAPFWYKPKLAPSLGCTAPAESHPQSPCSSNHSNQSNIKNNQ